VNIMIYDYFGDCTCKKVRVRNTRVCIVFYGLYWLLDAFRRLL